MKRRVLVIEDDAESRYLESFLLRRQGFEVITASDGIEGLRLGLQSRPDAVLVDLELPGIDGFNLLREFRADTEMKDRALIVVSASCELNQQQRALTAGANAFICKPINAEDFGRQISELIGRESI